jgi:hypothetical protein
VGTIKSHLARLIASGEVEVHEVLPAEMIRAVIAFRWQKRCSSFRR